MSIDKKQIIIIISSILVIIIFIFIYIKFNNLNNSDNLYLSESSQNTNNTISENTSNKKIIIHIYGCVVDEGIVELTEGARINDAINSAGGSTLDADLSRINLAYQLKDGEKVYVPSINDEENIEAITSSSYDSSDSSSSGLININTATQSELETLNGIGPSTALKIIQFRKDNGKFDSIEDLKNVPGIGDSKFNGIKDSICV